MSSVGSKATREIQALCLLFATFTFIGLTEATDFDGCDHTYHIKPGYHHLKSPEYPFPYKPYSSCRYKYIAPVDHTIYVSCKLNFDQHDDLLTEYFYLTDAKKHLILGQDSSGEIRGKSKSHIIFLAYLSGGSTGSFECTLNARNETCDCGWSTKSNVPNRLVNSNDYPSMVALKDTTTTEPLYCSAVIISHRYLLTAAYCVNIQPNPAHIEAWVGRYQIEPPMNPEHIAFYNIDRIIKHPNYTTDPVNNDIALLVTTKDIKYNIVVRPICLPPLTKPIIDFAYNNVDLIGWGHTRFAATLSPIPSRIIQKVTDNKVCGRIFQNLDTIYPTQICTYDYRSSYNDSCQLHPGGPVILHHRSQFLIGIITHGKGCSLAEHPTGVHTRVTSYLQWIYENTGYSICNVTQRGYP